jgi:hypothetical protein
LFPAAENLEFETAARIRDQLNKLHAQASGAPEAPEVPDAPPPSVRGRKASSRAAVPSKKKSGITRKPGSSEVPDSSIKGA